VIGVNSNFSSDLFRKLLASLYKYNIIIKKRQWHAQTAAPDLSKKNGTNSSSHTCTHFEYGSRAVSTQKHSFALINDGRDFFMIRKLSLQFAHHSSVQKLLVSAIQHALCVFVGSISMATVDVTLFHFGYREFP
jgi:hypothetical protein